MKSCLGSWGMRGKNKKRNKNRKEKKDGNNIGERKGEKEKK